MEVNLITNLNGNCSIFSNFESLKPAGEFNRKFLLRRKTSPEKKGEILPRFRLLLFLVTYGFVLLSFKPGKRAIFVAFLSFWWLWLPRRPGRRSKGVDWFDRFKGRRVVALERAAVGYKLRQCRSRRKFGCDDSFKGYRI
tara:strand:+ start:793 stop:1212 length:420 start_codon:yes stop_codon:yes gene_type:complete